MTTENFLLDDILAKDLVERNPALIGTVGKGGENLPLRSFYPTNARKFSNRHSGF